ncbi:MAG: ParB N-terminal domain-containing protein [Nitrososphaerota archaeon]|nr:ParB N-terminal domain-containing protein [Nitrososphaerota archaeon]
MKLLRDKPKASGPKSEGRLVALPVKLCEPHPDLQTRLKYDQVDALAEDIKVHGQLQPGRAVERPDGTGYYVYMGIGRLLAVKQLFEGDGEPKSYYALLDEGLPFVELFSRSMSENLKRRNLSVLEEVRSFYLASQKADEDEIVAASAKIGEEPSMVRKRIELARILGDKLKRLYEVERRGRAGFSFQLGHLDVLSKIGDEKELYEFAAGAANAGFNVKEFQNSLKNKSIDKMVSGLPEWFGELFPEYARKEEKPSLPTDMNVVQHVVMAPVNPKETTKPDAPTHSSQGAKDAAASTTTRAQAESISTTKTESNAASQPPAGVPYKESLHFAACPYCGAMTPFELKEDSELTLIRFRGAAVPEKEAVAPEGSYRAMRKCFNPECGEEFWLWVATVEGEAMAESRKKGSEEDWFSLPKEKPEVGSVSWSGERKSWVVKKKENGKEFLYGEDKKFASI